MTRLRPLIGGNYGGKYPQPKAHHAFKKQKLSAPSVPEDVDMALFFAAWSHAGEIDFS
jgi:hypothetical protein